MGDRAMIVGPGRAGLALGYALWQAEALESLSYCGRQPEPPAHPLFMEGLAPYFFGLEPPGPGITAVLLTVPDDVLPEMAHTMAGQGEAPEGCVALHCSGTLSVEVLAPLHARGYHVGSLHPLQALANPITGAERLMGSWFAVSGESEALAVARRLVARLDGTPLAIPVARRPLYHAAGVVASNYLPVLLALSARLLVLAGIDEDDAIPALLPLMRGTLDNVAELGLAPALTRADFPRRRRDRAAPPADASRSRSTGLPRPGTGSRGAGRGTGTGG